MLHKQQYRPLWRGLVGPSLFLGLVLTTDGHPTMVGILQPLDVLTARITAFLIGSLGLDALRRSTVLIHPSGFGYEIYYYCTGLVPAAFLVAGVLSAPAGWASKLWAIGVGVPLVLALNLTRLVSLFVIGVSFPRAFAFAHDVAGQALMVFGVFGLWLVWLRRAARASPGAALTTPRDVLAAPAASRL